MTPSNGQAPVAGRAAVAATFYVCMRPTWIVEWLVANQHSVCSNLRHLEVRHWARFGAHDPTLVLDPMLRR